MSGNKASETGRRFAVFHVTEHGESVHFLAEENLELLPAAVKLSEYIRKPPEDSPMRFLGMFSRGERISARQFDIYVQERLDNTGIVAGAFDIDLDKGTFDALHIMDGWHRFRIQDVCTAACCAMEEAGVSWDERWKLFLDRLDGMQLTTTEEACRVGLRLRDILPLLPNGDRLFICHAEAEVCVPSENLCHLTDAGQKDFASLLNARVLKIVPSEDATEVVISDVPAEELLRFNAAFHSFQEAEENMWLSM